MLFPDYNRNFQLMLRPSQLLPPLLLQQNVQSQNSCYMYKIRFYRKSGFLNNMWRSNFGLISILSMNQDACKDYSSESMLTRLISTVRIIVESYQQYIILNIIEKYLQLRVTRVKALCADYLVLETKLFLIFCKRLIF